MPPFVNAHRAPLDLASGRVLAPGEQATAKEVDKDSRHDAALIAEGRLLDTAEAKRGSSAKPEED